MLLGLEGFLTKEQFKEFSEQEHLALTLLSQLEQKANERGLLIISKPYYNWYVKVEFNDAGRVITEISKYYLMCVVNTDKGEVTV